MNKTILMGRLTRDPTVRFSAAGKKITSYTLAVRRSYKGTDGITTDFLRCVCIYESQASFAAEHFYKGIKVLVTGRLQSGSYTNKDGQKIYTTDVLVENQEYAEGKKGAPDSGRLPTDAEGYLVIPDGIDDELPFK